MNETKQIDPAALGTLACGTVLCDWPKVHEAAEWLMGHPVWTHEFPRYRRDIEEAVLAQFPDMPTDEPEDWEARVASLRARYGETVAVKKGDRQRDVGPLETAHEIVPEDVQIIAIVK